MAFPAHIYAAECLTIKNKFHRNSLSTWTGITAAMGMFLITLLSYFCTYQGICTSITSFSVALFIIVAVLLPESPVWLKSHGCFEDADRCQKKLGFSEPPGELKSDSKLPTEQPKKFKWLGWTKNLQKLKRKDVYMPTIIITMADIILVMSGSTTVANYQVFIIGSRPHDMDPQSQKYFAYMCSLFSASLQLLAHILTTILLLRISGKLIVVSSCVLVAATISLLGYTQSDAGPTSLIFESVATWLNIFAHSLEIYLTPIALMGGAFPGDALEFSSVPVVAVGVASGILVQIHPYLVDNIGNTLYYIYASISLLAGLFTLIFFDEISGKKAKTPRQTNLKPDSGICIQNTYTHDGSFYII